MVCTVENFASPTTLHKLIVEAARRAKLWRINFQQNFQFPLLNATLILVAFYRATTNERVSKIVRTIFKHSVFRTVLLSATWDKHKHFFCSWKSWKCPL